MNKWIGIWVLCLAGVLGAQAANISWISGGGADTEWTNVNNWATDYLPGNNTNGVVDRADFLAGNDIATVTSDVSTTNNVNIFMRNNGNITISADMNSIEDISIGTTGSASGFGTFIKQSGGTVTAAGNILVGTDDNNGGLYELSGTGALNLDGDATIGANGKISIIGNNASMTAGDAVSDAFTMLTTGILDFQFDANGVGTIAAGTFTVDSTNSKLIIDALAYEGAAATFDLVTFSTNIGTFATNNISVTGVKSWSVGYDTDSMFVSLVPLGPGDIKMIGKDDFDGAGGYSTRTIVGEANTSGGITWAVVSRDTITYPGMIDTSVAAGGAVVRDVADELGFLGTNKTDNIFGMYRAGASRSLTYTFDITSYTNLNLLVDLATSGPDFRDKDVSMSYFIDGGATNTILDIGVSTNDWTETMDNGTELLRSYMCPVTVNGVVSNSLTDEFQTYNPTIDGAGSNLTLTIVMTSGVGGFGGMGMDNLQLYGTIAGTPDLPEIGDVTIEVVSAGTEVALSWQTDASYTYGVQSKADLTDLVWDNIITNVPGTGFEVTVTNAVSDAEFYRAYIEQ